MQSPMSVNQAISQASNHHADNPCQSTKQAITMQTTHVSQLSKQSPFRHPCQSTKQAITMQSPKSVNSTSSQESNHYAVTQVSQLSKQSGKQSLCSHPSQSTKQAVTMQSPKTVKQASGQASQQAIFRTPGRGLTTDEH